MKKKGDFYTNPGVLDKTHIIKDKINTHYLQSKAY